MLQAANKSSEDIEYMVRCWLLFTHTMRLMIPESKYEEIEDEELSPLPANIVTCPFLSSPSIPHDRWKICQPSCQGMQWSRRQKDGEKNSSYESIIMSPKGIRLNPCVVLVRIWWSYTISWKKFNSVFKNVNQSNHSYYSLRWEKILGVVVWGTPNK